jgi:signal transduction histidine kinase
MNDVLLIIAIGVLALLVFLVGLQLYIIQRNKKRHADEIYELNQSISRSQIEIQEQILDDVARELHDNFNPTLSIIHLNLSAITSSQSPLKTAELISDSKLMIRSLMTEMRTLSRTLSPNLIERIGFIKSLEEYANRVKKSGYCEVLFNSSVKSGTLQLPPSKAIIIFRIFQEIINNIIKHAEANKVVVEVIEDSSMLIISIADNGKGFDLSKAKLSNTEGESSGLSNIQKRVRAIDAILNIETMQNKGTTIKISIPLTNDA